LPEVLLRASYGEGFRMPALDNLYSPSSFTNTGGNFTDPYYDTISGCVANPNTDFCNTQLTVQNNSNPSLKPEKSKQTSIGIVLEPMKGLTLEATYFDIKITDGISALTGDDILKDWFAKRTGPTTSSSVYSSRLVIDPATGYLNYVKGSLENLSQARVSGFDMAAKYVMRTSFGKVTPSWDGTFMTKSTTTNVVSGLETDNLGKYARGGPVVRQKHKFGLDFDTGDFSYVVRYDWQMGYEDYSTVRNVNNYGLFDVQLSYRGIKNLTLTGGVRNLLNTTPPVSDQADYFQVGFDPTYGDVKGRRVYLGANYKF
jgi:iron complex outermembrane receptor protein